MKTYNGLPLYEVAFNDENSVFNWVSIVTEPAIMENFIQLSKQEDNQVQLKIDDEQRIVSGPALVPNLPIYRNQGGHKFYITWSEETIKQVAINFFQHGRQNEGNIEHQVPVNGVCFFESYILDKERGIVPKEFEDLPSGTWILSAKITNDEVWELVKDGSLTGFSIDMSGVEFKEEKVLETLDDFFNYLNEQ